MRRGTVPLACGYAWLAGTRSLFAPLAASVRIVAEGGPPRRGPFARTIGRPGAARALAALAAGEAIVDLLPRVPDRTAPALVPVHVAAGAVAATAIAESRGAGRLGGALVGLAGAAVAFGACHAQLAVRRRAARALAVPERPLGLAEDAAAVGLAAALSRA